MMPLLTFNRLAAVVPYLFTSLKSDSMRIYFYSAHKHEIPYLKAAFSKVQMAFTEKQLTLPTVSLSAGYDTISLFTCDDASAPVINHLHEMGVRRIALRSSGYDHVDLEAAAKAGMRVAYVPSYSPSAVAEHTLLLILALLRQLPVAIKQVELQNFCLDHLVGSEINGKRVGIVGTGRIGSTIARILKGFDCTLLAFDQNQDRYLEEECGLHYTDLDTICSTCDIISLHLPLTPETHHLFNAGLIGKMKADAVLVNTAHGGILDTEAVVDALKNKKLGAFGMDVYEHEKGLFYEDHTGAVLSDPVFDCLQGLTNVIITPHMAFASGEALKTIAQCTFDSLWKWEHGEASDNELVPAKKEAVAGWSF
jgi:D-lactate dehydrogenase